MCSILKVYRHKSHKIIEKYDHILIKYNISNKLYIYNFKFNHIKTIKMIINNTCS
jgi:hypothetical protein